ncbi:hypothetical protein [Dactylosporangium sp. NPDC000521]|uniref:hypothetical protein n=1 Tax=Dactylosporangium sp. NPDC000521 TaxID=3363975 RepID=UPI0036B76625
MAKDLWWRIGLPAVGLAVAVAVGWRLSTDAIGPVVVFAWLPLAAWCLFVPRVPAALGIALFLLAAIATIQWTLPGELGDRSIVWPTLMWYLVPGSVTLLVAAGRSQPFRIVPTLMACAALLFACGVGVVSWNQVGGPSADELFPLPAGLTATSATGPDGPDGCDGCDQRGFACWRYYRVTGTAGDSTADLIEGLRRHLQETKGWGTAVAGLALWDETESQSCRPVRRLGLPAATDLCVAVISDPASTADRPAIGVELSMSKIGRAA